MMDTVAAALVDVLTEFYPASALAVPAGVATPLVFADTTDLIDERDGAAVCRVDAQDGVTMRYPLENDDPAQITIGYTVTLKRAEIPALAQVPVQGMRRAALRCAEAVVHAMVTGLEARAHVERFGVAVRTPQEITINEPDTDVDAAVTSVTVTAVHPVDPRWMLTRSL